MRAMRVTVLLVVSLAILAGCGPMPAAPPTIGATDTAPTEQPATAAPASPAAEQLTLGDLAARIASAWSDVQSYQVTFTGPAAAQPATAGGPVASPLATPGASPIARARGGFVSVREVVLPDRQRQTVTGLGADDHEAVAIGEELFIRGPLADQIAPGTPADTWITVDTALLAPESMVSRLLGGLPRTPAAPLASIPERLASQPVRDLGPVEFNGRQCQTYGAADTVPATGMRVDYVIAIDDRDRPCFIETSTGGAAQGRDEYREIDGELTIVAPAAATPASIPAALATPIARD